MEIYKVKLTPEADDYLQSYISFLVNRLCNPFAANTFLYKFAGALESLTSLPARGKIIKPATSTRTEIYRIPVHNSFLYYRISESLKTVYIIAILTRVELYKESLLHDSSDIYGNSSIFLL